MDFEEKETFNNYINSFIKLPINLKRDNTIKELKEILTLLNKLEKDKNPNYKVLFNREILDLNKKEYTEDDYIEAVFVYINSIKKVLLDYLDEESGANG